MFLRLALSFAFGGLAALTTLTFVATDLVIAKFGRVTIWQVWANAGEPISLLPPDLRRLVWFCLGITATVGLVSAVFHFLVIRIARNGGGMRRSLIAHAYFVLLTAIHLSFAFERLDERFGIRYELSCLSFQSSLFRDELRVVPPAAVRFPAGRRNLIVIVAESIEESFLDGSAYGVNLMPRLADWRRRHGTFGAMLSPHASDHTICSLFGMVYGIPRLYTDGRFDHVSWCNYPEVVLPNVWDIWLRNGFSCKFVQGGPISFACTDKVFRAVPDVEICDEASFREDPDYVREPEKHPFGVNDEVVMRRLRAETAALAEGGGPFVLIAWTLNTHCPYGWTSAFSRKRHENRLADAVMQADDLICDYLDWLETQPFFGTTTVVVVGDHPVHGSVGDQPFVKRHPFNAVADNGTEIRHRDGLFAPFDLAPTFLELTGASIPSGRFGIGRSLLSGQPTLLDRIGRACYDREIRGCCADFRRLALGL